MFGLTLNPWMLLAGVIGLAILTGGVGYKAYQFGGNAARIVCERRVDDLQARYDKQAKEIEALNKSWQGRIDALVDEQAKEAETQQKEQEELQKKVDDYEKTIGDATGCITDQSDVDRLR